jgi:3-deoxy-D-manno-octulosonate 8-phosphate phosphatase (KDO 8-P phosphatase)
MKLVGLPTCPQEASPEIKGISKYISHKTVVKALFAM